MADRESVRRTQNLVALTDEQMTRIKALQVLYGGPKSDDPPAPIDVTIDKMLDAAELVAGQVPHG